MPVCLAVWLAIGARTITDRVLAVLFPVSAFVAAGFEHSVANMYLIPLGLFLKAWTPAASWMSSAATAPDLAALTWSAFFTSLVPVTIGNIIGGGLLVGGGYWLIYLRPSHASGQQIWPGCEWQLHHQASYRPHCYSQLNDYNDHVDYKKVWSHGRAYLDSR